MVCSWNILCFLFLTYELAYELNINLDILSTYIWTNYQVVPYNLRSSSQSMKQMKQNRMQQGIGLQLH